MITITKPDLKDSKKLVEMNRQHIKFHLLRLVVTMSPIKMSALANIQIFFIRSFNCNFYAVSYVSQGVIYYIDITKEALY